VRQALEHAHICDEGHGGLAERDLGVLGGKTDVAGASKIKGCADAVAVEAADDRF